MKQLEKQAREAYVAAKEAEVEERNFRLEEIYSEIDSLLLSTLAVDDHVDLEAFRKAVQHPNFSEPDLERKCPEPEPIRDPAKPLFVAPAAPSGLVGRLFGKKKHAANMAEARETHERALANWRRELDALPARREAQRSEYLKAESRRIAALDEARERYARECERREIDVAESNRRLDTLIANLSYGVPEAVQEYVSIVLANSSYPEHFPVSHAFEFDPIAAELSLRVTVPAPGTIPEIKAYRYAKSSDEIVESNLSQKACRERYASAIHQTALRSIHEVFESDRRAVIRTITLLVGAEANDPATGVAGFVPFVRVGAERDAFLKFDLSGVVPAMTLSRLGAAMAKNPYSLEAIETTGIRRS